MNDSDKKEYDIVSKRLYENPHICSSLLNGYLFNGKSKIKAKDLTYLSTEEVVKNLDGEVDQRLRDLLLSATIQEDGERYYVVFGIESQSKPEKYMPLRVLDYNIKYLMRQAEAKPKYLKPVITLVVYTGERKWNYKKNLYSLFDNREGMRRYNEACVPDFSLNLIDIRRMSDEEIIKYGSTLSTVFFSLKYQANGEKILSLVNEKKSKLPSEAVDAINVFTKSKFSDYIEDEEGEVNMISLYDSIKNYGMSMGLEEGQAKGIAMGRTEGVAIGRAEGVAEGSSNAYYNSVKGAMKGFGVSAEKAMDALNVPLSDREAILKKLKDEK